MSIKQSKALYSTKNLEGTYQDLAIWFTEVLKEGKKKEVTKFELIKFLETKGRVPSSILKKNKDVRVQQPQCCARVVKEFAQCKNESEYGDSNFCKVHNTHLPKFTMAETIEEIQLKVDAEKTEKKKVKKASKKKVKKVSKKAASKKAEVSEEEEEDKSNESDSGSTLFGIRKSGSVKSNNSNESAKTVDIMPVTVKSRRVRRRVVPKVVEPVEDVVEDDDDSDEDESFEDLIKKKNIAVDTEKELSENTFN